MYAYIDGITPVGMGVYFCCQGFHRRAGVFIQLFLRCPE